jgi:hypothetical protein
MQDPMTAVNASQWIQVHKGLYKGDLGFVTHVETWGARVLVIPCLKTATLQTATLKRKQTAIRPEPRLFKPTSSSLCTNESQNFKTLELTPLVDSFLTMDCSCEPLTCI